MRPELAETIPFAYVVSDDGDGTVVVRPADTKRKRRVSGAFVYAACIDGASSLAFRGQGGGTAGRAVSRARSAEAKTTAKAARAVAAASTAVAKAEKKAAAANAKAKAAEAAASAKIAKVEKKAAAAKASAEAAASAKIAMVEKKAAAANATAEAAASTKIAMAEKKAAAANAKAKAAKAAAAKSEAHENALFCGDPDDPRLSGRGRKLAKVLNADADSEFKRLARVAESERRGRIKAERKAADALAREVLFIAPCDYPHMS